MSHDRNGNVAAAGLLVAIGIAVGGYFVGHGLLEARSSDRYVTVRGLAEREVPANLVVWPITCAVTADDLATLQRRNEESVAKIRDFLADDFSDDEISSSEPRITDRQAQGVVNQGGRLERYVAQTTVTVRSTRIDAVQAAMVRTGELVGQSVALVRNYNPTTNEDLIRKAYAYADKMHDGQRRHSGEPYFTHPVAVAAILTEAVNPGDMLMLMLHGLKLGLEPVVSRVSAQLAAILTGFGDRVLFAELNLKLGLLWVSVAPEPGLCHEVAQTVRAHLPETRVIGSWMEGPRRKRLQSSYSEARLASPRTLSRG